MPRRSRAKSRWSASISSPPSAASCCRSSFWRRFAAIENVVAIKIAPFNRYRTLDVVRGVVEAGAADRITLYTGNDDHIVLDLVTPFTVTVAAASRRPCASRAACSGTGACGSKSAVELLERIHASVGSARSRPTCSRSTRP